MDQGSCQRAAVASEQLAEQEGEDGRQDGHLKATNVKPKSRWFFS